MRSELHVTTRVLPGNRVEVQTPEIPEGQNVEVTIRVPAEQPHIAPKPGILDLINSFRPSTRTQEEWEEFDREFQRERDSWDR
ncbi:MAG: hypothetical protein WBD40_06445 [Tepidisphaeraceae bacterium]